MEIKQIIQKLQGEQLPNSIERTNKGIIINGTKELIYDENTMQYVVKHDNGVLRTIDIHLALNFLNE